MRSEEDRDGGFEILELRGKHYDGGPDDMEIWEGLVYSIVQAVSWVKPDVFDEACEIMQWAVSDEKKRRAKDYSNGLMDGVLMPGIPPR